MFMPACFVFLPSLAWIIIPMEWEFTLLDEFKVSPWRLYLLLSSLLNGINFICLYQFPESPKFLLSINRKEETLNVLRRMYSINTQLDQQVCTNIHHIWPQSWKKCMFIDVSSKRSRHRIHRNCFKWSSWYLWHFKIGMESNLAIVSTTTP